MELSILGETFSRAGAILPGIGHLDGVRYNAQDQFVRLQIICSWIFGYAHREQGALTLSP